VITLPFEDFNGLINNEFPADLLRGHRLLLFHKFTKRLFDKKGTAKLIYDDTIFRTRRLGVPLPIKLSVGRLFPICRTNNQNMVHHKNAYL
jgi:hypothetical protein